MSKLTKDRALALLILLLVAVLFIEANKIPPRASWQPYGSAFYPRMLLSVVAVLAGLLLVRSFLPGTEKQRPLIPEVLHFLSKNPRIIAILALFAAFAALLPHIGYIASSICFLTASFWVLAKQLTRKRAAIGIVIAVASTTIVYVIFQHGLGIRLP